MAHLLLLLTFQADASSLVCSKQLTYCKAKHLFMDFRNMPNGQRYRLKEVLSKDSVWEYIQCYLLMKNFEKLKWLNNNLWWHLFLVIHRSKENSLSNTQLIFFTEEKTVLPSIFGWLTSESNKAFIIIKNAKLTLFWGSYYTFIMIDFVWNSYFKKMNSNGISGEN